MGENWFAVMLFTPLTGTSLNLEGGHEANN